MPQLRPESNPPKRHALFRDEVSEMRYTDDKVIPREFLRKDPVEDYFQEKMNTDKEAFGPNLKKGVDT